MNALQEGIQAGSDRNSIQVIARAAQVLRLLSDEIDGLSLTEIARATGLARSTIQRIVKALGDEGFVEAAAVRGGVRLGPALLKLASSRSFNIVEVATPFLQELAREVDETVDLSTLRGQHAVFVEHIAGSHRLAALSSVGTEFPLHSTANGKALLSCLPSDQQRRLLGNAPGLETSRTKTDIGEIMIEIRKVKETGLAFDLEEHTEGVCAVGAAFTDLTGTAYAISIPVPRQRFDAKVCDLEAPLLRCRDRLIAKINGSLPMG